MRPMILAVAIAALLSACGQPEAATRVDPAFGAKVRAYLLANPEVLVEVSNALKIKQSREAIGAYRQQLERDPRDRVLNPSGKVIPRCGSSSRTW